MLSGKKPPEIYERFRDEYQISTDRGLLDMKLVWEFLSSEAWWSKGIPRHRVEQAIQNSICFGLYKGKKQIGFVRVLSDNSILAYVMDMFIVEEYRGQGLAEWLLQCMLEHPRIRRVKRIMLRTLHQRELFQKFGFEEFTEPQTVMSKIQDRRGYDPPEDPAKDGDHIGK